MGLLIGPGPIDKEIFPRQLASLLPSTIAWMEHKGYIVRLDGEGSLQVTDLGWRYFASWK